MEAEEEDLETNSFVRPLKDWVWVEIGVVDAAAEPVFDIGDNFYFVRVGGDDVHEHVDDDGDGDESVRGHLHY